MSRMTATLDEEGRLILPTEVRHSLGLKAGDQVVLELDQTGAHLRPSEASPAFVAPAETGEGEAWEAFFRLGDKIAGGDTQESGTLTAAVLAMRR